MNLPSLTPRQITIWEMIANGICRKQASDKLRIHVKTYDNHRKGLCERLKIECTADLTRAAIAHGVIPVPTVENLTVKDFAK